MRSGIAVSIGVHAVLLLLLIFGLPFLHPKPQELPPMITVDVIDMAKDATTNKISTANKVEKTVQEDTPPPQVAPPPAPDPTPAPPTPTPPEPKPVLEPMPKLAPVNDAAPDIKVPDVSLRKPLAPAPELSPVDSKVADLQLPPKVDLKRPEPKVQPESMADVLKNLSKQKLPQMAQPTPTPDTSKSAKPATGAQAPLSANLTASELAAVQQQLNGCMNWPDGADSKANLTVQLDVTVNPDRTVASAHVVDQDRLSSDPIYAASARAALRALRVAQCSPLDLPPDKYQTWHEMTINLTPPH
jgi:hypothetical protein